MNCRFNRLKILFLPKESIPSARMLFDFRVLTGLCSGMMPSRWKSLPSPSIDVLIPSIIGMYGGDWLQSWCNHLLRAWRVCTLCGVFAAELQCEAIKERLNIPNYHHGIGHTTPRTPSGQSTRRPQVIFCCNQLCERFSFFLQQTFWRNTLDWKEF